MRFRAGHYYLTGRVRYLELNSDTHDDEMILQALFDALCAGHFLEVKDQHTDELLAQFRLGGTDETPEDDP